MPSRGANSEHELRHMASRLFAGCSHRIPRGTIAAMDAVMERERLTMNGRHHEIYATPVTEQHPAQETKRNLRHPVQTLDH
jgi:hypothetical protein